MLFFRWLSCAAVRGSCALSASPQGFAAEGGHPRSRVSAFPAPARPFPPTRPAPEQGGPPPGSGIRSAVPPALHGVDLHDPSGPVTKALADRASSPDVHLDLGIPTSVSAPMESIDTELAARIRQDINPGVIFGGRTAVGSAAVPNPRCVTDPDQAGVAPVGTGRRHTPRRRPRIHGSEPDRGGHSSGG